MTTSDPPRPPEPKDVLDAVDDDRQAILARRSRFVAAAVVSLTGAAFVNCAACLSPLSDPSDERDASTLTDSGNDAADARPQACLSIARDAEADALSDAKSDALPQPCLVPPLPDSGRDE